MLANTPSTGPQAPPGGLHVSPESARGPVLGVLVSIVANAYVGTGLAAATMIFYRDRFLHSARRTNDE